MVVVTPIKMIEVCIQFAQKLLINFYYWSKKVGNDLITPHPEFGFPGLKMEIAGAFALLGMLEL